VTEAYLKVLGLHANNPDVDILRARLAESIPEEFMWKWHHLVKHVDLDPGPILAAEVGNLPRKFTDFELLMGIDANTYTYIDAAVGQITQEVMAGSAQPGVALEQASESAAEARTAPDQPAPQSRIAFDDRILPRLARRAEDIVDLIFLTAAEDDDGRLHLSCAEWQPILSRHVQGMIEWAEQELSDISADAPDDFFYFLRSKIAVTARNECRRIWDDLTANVELEKDPLGMDTQLLVDSAATALAQKIASMARPKPEMADGVNVAREAIHGLLKLAVVSPAGRRREAGAKARQGEAGGPVSEARTESWAERMAAFIEKVSTIEDPIIQSDVHSALRHKTAKTWQNLKNGVGTTQAARDYSRLFAMSRDEFIALRRQLS
jgi:hypothetical protein